MTLTEDSAPTPEDPAARVARARCRGSPDAAGRAIFTSAAYGELPRELVEKNRIEGEDPEIPLHSLAEETSSKPENRYAMARTHEWKFLLSESRPPELYRMSDGWVERQNVAGQPEYASVRRDMEQRLRSFWRW